MKKTESDAGLGLIGFYLCKKSNQYNWVAQVRLTSLGYYKLFI